MTMGHTVRKYPWVLALYFASITLCDADLVPAKDIAPTFLNSSRTGELGKEAVLTCSFSPETVDIEWQSNGAAITPNDRIKLKNETKELEQRDEDGGKKMYKISTLTIINTTATDHNNYTCRCKLGDKVIDSTVNLNLSFPGELVKVSETIRRNATDPADVTLWCHFKVFNSTEVVWRKNGDDISDLNEKSRVLKIDAKHINATYDLTVRHTDDDGTYTCTVWDPVTSEFISGEVKILVYAAPVVTIEKVIAISSSQLYLNWTVRAFNSPIIDYTLWYKNGSDFRQYNKEKINVNQTSFVMEGLQKSTEYELGLEVATTFGKSKKYMQKNKTLESDPSFVPNITINGFSATSVTIGWASPPPEIAEYIHYYLLEARKKNESEPKRAYHSKDSRNPYMFDDLEPHSTYVFRVCACSEYTNKCGNWSKEMDAITLDGIPGKPNNVVIHCPNEENNYINLTWQPPLKPNAEIKGYSVELTSNATYVDRYGLVKHDMSGSKLKFMSNEARRFRYDDIKPNTNYTVRVSAMTRTRRRGDDETRSCRVPPAPPDAPPRPRWRKVMEGTKYLFKLYLPRVSERNGPICCYRIYMVRLPPAYNWNNLRSPQDINIVRYAEAHSVQPTLTAYITDLFTNEDFPSESELVMGDGIPKISSIIKPSCQRCLKKPKRPYHEIVTPKTTVTTTTTTTSKQEVEDDGTTDNPEIEEVAEIAEKSDRVIMMESIAEEEEPVENITAYIQDGPLDSTANYTLFVELIPDLPEGAALYSEFVNVLMPAPSPTAARSSTTLEIALQATCACAALVLLAMIVFCVLQTRRSRKLPPGANLELDPIRKVFRIFVGLGGRQQLVTAVPPDLPPIAKEDLAAAYAERQADSDYGFQKEFEILPECFTDRTTHASEARENQPKNRYPDIKAYDQTRVKLAQIDSVTGSDYINANYVRGYKEPKKFICAQGPTETTVNDFWRMIWEHDLELIVMLTNLEEYSKVKCSKYWPDEVRGFKAFGNITVHHVSEKRYSDYIVRELKITKQLTNAEGQPIVENNGIAKRNGDCKDAESASAPTSPRESKESTARIVRQYHFLMWKDFAAPEYPYSILRFIKRVNEAWSNLLGRPAVVHCSAGVGRTGTLVALDCLLEQLRATGHVAVFNTVAELRTQRNFLVQSLKQYVFVYRALVEYAHFGDTEIPARRLKAAIDRLRNTPEGADKCLMEHEFEKILKCPIAEGLKSCAAGGGEEVRSRNRSNDCLPYDRNRVILAPVPQRDYSTYINASFIEAYDNTEGFIITQDPLPNTIMDFWRMVSEHNVSTIVMLSEIGEGKCPRYWDDGTAQYEHIAVQYEESESCPYYTRRQFRVTNNKNGEVISVRQLQYQGWPTAPGHVPEVTRGLADLADAARPEAEPGSGPMLVHCQYGTERSSLFVALCILICQLRTERRVDVCTVARKVRSQRARTIDTFLQYEFLHRAILNYAELHNLLEES